MTAREYLEQHGISETSIQKFGLKDQGERLGIPIKDENGQVIYHKYRHLNFVQHGSSGNKFSFDPGYQARLFNEESLKSYNNYLFLCEGEIDCIRLDQEGWVALSGTAGANTFKDEWIDKLADKNIFVVFDNDKVGKKASGVVSKKLVTVGAKVRVVTLPEDCKDLCEFFIKGHTKKELLELCKNTELVESDENHKSDNDDFKLDKSAYYGIAGKFVKLIEPHSESDPAAVLVSFLAAFGNIIGNGSHFNVEAAKHPMRIFVAIVGKSSKSRKGTGWAYIERVFTKVDPAWQINSGLSSGEGIIYAVRDKVTKKETDKRTKQTEEVVVDVGVEDKRLLIIEEEFSAVLKQVNRQGNILSQVVRSGWDKNKLQTLTKNSPTKATGAHISIVGHITVEELIRCLTSTEISNGFGNRFIWIYSKRSKELPNGGNLNESDLNDLIEKLKRVVNIVQGLNKPSWTGEEIDSVTSDPAFSDWPIDTQVKWSEKAQLLWNKIYHDLSEEKPGIVGALTSRSEAYVCRLASIYALLDRSFQISIQHLRAAVAVWDYSYASVRRGKTNT